jgi:hypothetical protein
MLFLVLLLIFGCTPEGDIDSGVSSDDSDDDSDVWGDTDDEEELAEGDNGIWNLEDFSDLTASSIVEIVPYNGWISQENWDMASTLTDTFSYEKDVIRRDFYNFNGVMAYFDDGTAQFYVKNIDGWLFYSYSEVTEYTDGEEVTTVETTIGPVSSSVVVSADEPSKIGTLSEGGEYTFAVYPRYYGEVPSVTATRVSASSGEFQTDSVSFDFSLLSTGGGNDGFCSGDTSDMALSGPSNCELYISGKSMIGTHVDSIYAEEEDGFSNHILKTEWSLVPIGSEGDPVDDNFSDTDGFNFWLGGL